MAESIARDKRQMGHDSRKRTDEEAPPGVAAGAAGAPDNDHGPLIKEPMTAPGLGPDFGPLPTSSEDSLEW